MAATPASRPEGHRICNLLPSRGTERDWNMSQALAANAVAAPPAIPPSVDLRAPWWGIGDQEATGSCVGWASTDSLARYHMVKAGKLSPDERLSPRYTWMASKETDEIVNRPETFIEAAGTTLKAALEILRTYGAVSEAMLPFHLATTMYDGDENTFFANAATRRIASYFNLSKSLDDWRAWLAAHGPILTGLIVDATWDNATATKGKLDDYQPNTGRGGHAICVVGYTADKRFIIRNSWGTGWGDQGYAYASEAYIQAGFYNEAYGVTV